MVLVNQPSTNPNKALWEAVTLVGILLLVLLVSVCHLRGFFGGGDRGDDDSGDNDDGSEQGLPSDSPRPGDGGDPSNGDTDTRRDGPGPRGDGGDGGTSNREGQPSDSRDESTRDTEGVESPSEERERPHGSRHEGDNDEADEESPTRTGDPANNRRTRQPVNGNTVTFDLPDGNTMTAVYPDGARPVNTTVNVNTTDNTQAVPVPVTQPATPATPGGRTTQLPDIFGARREQQTQNPNIFTGGEASAPPSAQQFTFQQQLQESLLDPATGRPRELHNPWQDVVSVGRTSLSAMADGQEVNVNQTRAQPDLVC